MQNIQELFNKREYRKVIELVKNSSDHKELFYGLSSYISLGEVNQALSFIKQKEKLLKNDLYHLIKFHIEILLIAKRFSEARKALDYYQNYPYESQKVEELLKELPERINKEEHEINNHHYLSNEDIISFLSSNDEETLLLGLEALRDKDVLVYLPYLKKLLVSPIRQAIRTYTLLLLVEKEVDRELNYLSLDKLITVNPKKLPTPIDKKECTLVINSMESDYKNPAIRDTAIQLYSTYILNIYPNQIKEEPALILATFYLLACSYLNDNNHTEQQRVLSLYQIDDAKIADFLAKTKDILNY